MNWKDISYLLNGEILQQDAYRAVKRLNILEVLKKYNPILVGTIPIAVNVDGSDLDIVCEVHDFIEFENCVVKNFGENKKFELFRKNSSDEQIVVVNFFSEGFEFEIYAASIPTEVQNGYRHMIIEHRVLEICGEGFRKAIIELKNSGLKTEPSFAKLLGLVGDPYIELFRLEELSDEEISEMYK